MKKNINTKKGFTIVELLVVIVVIGILAGISLVSYSGVTARANAAAMKANLDSVSSAAANYYAGVGYYPSALHIVDGLDASGEVNTDIISKLSSGVTLKSDATVAYAAGGAATRKWTDIDATNGKSYFEYIEKGAGAAASGACIAYWDFTTSAVLTKFIGDATEFGPKAPTDGTALAETAMTCL